MLFNLTILIFDKVLERQSHLEMFGKLKLFGLKLVLYIYSLLYTELPVHSVRPQHQTSLNLHYIDHKLLKHNVQFPGMHVPDNKWPFQIDIPNMSLFCQWTDLWFLEGNGEIGMDSRSNLLGLGFSWWAAIRFGWSCQNCDPGKAGTSTQPWIDIHLDQANIRG